MILRVQTCTGKCSKVLLLLINIIIFLVGGGCLGLGVFYHLNDGLYENVFKEAEVITIPVILMTFGSLLLLISIFAIIGALCEVVCMLKTYMAIVAIVLFLEVVLMAVCIAMKGKAEKEALSVIQNLMEHYGNETSDELDVITATIDQTQKWLQCCGLDGPYDWNDTDVATYWATINNRNDTGAYVLPKSCCNGSAADCAALLTPTAAVNVTDFKYYTEGCKEKLYSFVDANVTYISVGGIVLILMQCFILICALKIRFELDHRFDAEDYGSHMEMTSL